MGKGLVRVWWVCGLWGWMMEVGRFGVGDGVLRCVELGGAG